MLEKGDFKSQKEAAWAVTNTTTSGTPEQIIDLIEKYAILKPYTDLLDARDPCTIMVVQTGLSQLFGHPANLGGTPTWRLMFEEMGGLDKLENLLQHENKEIYKTAYALIDTFFRTDDDAEPELDVSDSDAPEGAFNFEFF